MNIRPIKKSFVFQFNDDVTSNGEFDNGTTAGGIILQSSFDDSAKQARWVTIVAAGNDCDDVVFHPGAQVLLPALRWTEASKFEGQKIWKSDETQVVAYKDGDVVVPIQNYVIFTQNKANVSQSQSGLLVVVGGVGDTASGIVVSVGSDAAEELQVGYKILYDDANFNDTFEHGGVKYAFIKDESIFAYEPN